VRQNVIKDRFAAEKIVVNAWLSLGSAYGAEGLGHAGFHSATIDLQHGMFSFPEALAMMQALSGTPATPLVRVQELNQADIMHLLDAGAYGVICPMVSTAEQAKDLVAACRYPPVGNRSFGLSRGLLYGGKDYVSKANDEIMAIPMIETAEAVDRIDEILGVDGVDMIYLGPNDLAFALEGDVAGSRQETEKALAHVLDRAARRGVATGIFCSGIEDAKARVDQGFNLITPSNDFSLLTRAGAAAVQAVLGQHQEDETASQSGGY
jgi:4-hydroxy-2-oxoheptanedioate aldolase